MNLIERLASLEFGKRGLLMQDPRTQASASSGKPEAPEIELAKTIPTAATLAAEWEYLQDEPFVHVPRL